MDLNQEYKFQSKELQLGNYEGSDQTFEGCIGGVMYDHTLLPLSVSHDNSDIEIDNKVMGFIYLINNRFF